MITRDDLPETPEWQNPQRVDPKPAVTIPANIILGAE
jgi:hypothetical protein